MCSRFHLNLYGKKILQEFPGYRDFKEGDFRPGDISPVFKGDFERLTLAFMHWGFHSPGRKETVFNARAESAEEKVMFRDSLISRRCAVPASWFYEWNRNKEKIKFERKEGNSLLYLAGIWRREEGGEYFTILTTEANTSMKSTHDRMPLLLKKEEIPVWIGEDRYGIREPELPGDVREVLRRVPEELKKSTDYEQLSLFSMGE